MRFLGPYAVLRRKHVPALTATWFHNLAAVGLVTGTRETMAANQAVKQPILFGLIDTALDGRQDATVLDLFCASGLYTFHALACGAKSVVGVDKDPTAVTQATIAGHFLGWRGPRVDFQRGDATQVTGGYDVGLCTGGLYHIADPAGLLTRLRSVVREVLVVQTVYDLSNDDPGHFVTPAPGWRHGCRFSLDWFRGTVDQSGWRVVVERTAELAGNDRPEDRGSVFMLCE